jgi:hypothetical protein
VVVQYGAEGWVCEDSSVLLLVGLYDHIWGVCEVVVDMKGKGKGEARGWKVGRKEGETYCPPGP